MEQEQPRVFRKLILPNISSNCQITTKPGPNSKKFAQNKFEYSFKDYLSKTKSFSYRCVNRTICKCILHIPISENYSFDYEFLEIGEIKGAKFQNEHTEACIRKYKEEKEISSHQMEIETFESNVSVLERYIRENPLAEPKKVQAEMIKQK